MKKVIISIFIIVICLNSFGQTLTPAVTPGVTGRSTLPVEDKYLFARQHFGLPRFSDTSQAITYGGIDSCGALIFSYAEMAVWFRSCYGGAKKWIMLDPSGAPASGNSWRLYGNNGLFTSASGNVPFGIKLPNYGISFITNNTTRLVLDSLGIVRNSGAANVALLMDSITKTLYYGTAGGGSSTAWNLTGNSGTTAGTDYLGTNDGQNLQLRTNSAKRLTINVNGALGLGTGEDYGTSGQALLTSGSSTAPTWGSPTIPINNLLAATGTNTIANTNYKQTWNWSGFGSITDGLVLGYSGSGAASNIGLDHALFRIGVTATNNTGSSFYVGQMINMEGAALLNPYNYGIVSNAKGAGVNVAGRFTATNGSNNYAIIVPEDSGSVGIGTDNPLYLLDVNGDLAVRGLASSTEASDSMMVVTASGGNAGKVGYRAIPSGGSPSLTSTYVGYGDGSNLLTGSSDLTWDGSVFSARGDVNINSVSGVAGFSSDGVNGISKMGDYGGNVNGNQLYVDDPNNLAYYDNTAHTGKFGINTSTPTVPLDVLGNVHLLGDATHGYIAGFASTDDALSIMGDIDNSGDGNAFTVNSILSTAFFDNSSHTGKFGVNTSTPIVALDILGEFRNIDSDNIGFTSSNTDIGGNKVGMGDYLDLGDGNKFILDNGNGLGYTTNGATNFKFGINTSSPTVAADIVGTCNISEVLKLAATAFASLPASPLVGMLANVSDSNTATWGATIAGGGANTVLAFYNGSNWTVMGK